VVPRDIDLKVVAALQKTRVVEFWGSEIRIPEIAVRDNPYLARLLAAPGATYRISFQDSRHAQERFARNGFACIVPGPELPAYVQTDLFPAPYQSEAVLFLQDFLPSYPSPLNPRPLVVHSPSRPEIKGTEAVLAAVEQVKARLDFDFRLVHNVPHSEALEILRGCDVFLDQFVIGSFGTAALEAMALGKPAVCYLKPSVADRLGSDAPFVYANPDNLGQVLESLLIDGNRRYEIGRRSRTYVERNHDAQVVARQLVTIYQELLDRNRRGTEDPNAIEREHRQTY
jgi:glycosyltransferase involved in cell wall biosynthesis